MSPAAEGFRRGAILVIAAMLGPIASLGAPAAEGAALPDDALPAADAIRLVLDRRADEIRAADSPQDRWFDTRERSWSARRLADPGYLDMTHVFVVVYTVDGVVKGRWGVDTKTGSIVSEAPQQR